MRLSTFDSSGDVPGRLWLRTWLLTAVLVISVLASWETVLRRRGYRPTVVDDKALWAGQRDRAYTDCCKEAVVLLGDCRMQLGLVPEILRTRFPRYGTAQLAVEETSPVAALRDLAADEDFRGIVLCALNARLLCKDLWDTQQPYVDYYHTEYSITKKVSRLLSAAVQQTFAFAHPHLRLDDLVLHLARKRRLPQPYYMETQADRSRLADYSAVDVQAHREWAIGRARWISTDRDLPSAAQWLADAMELEPYVQAIQGRGGRVVFVRFPTTGEHLRLDEFIFPKDRYWDAFAAGTSALCLHFQDVPQLCGFDCPDTSHLDRRDAPRFTLELAKVLEDRGVLTTSPCAAADRQAPSAPGRECICRKGLRRLVAWTKCLCCRAISRAG